MSLIFEDEESERLQKRIVEGSNANASKILSERIKYITTDGKWYKEYRQ